MAENTTRVVYKAIADFSALGKAARKARSEIRDLQKDEQKLNKQSVAGAAAATVAVGKHAKSREELIEAFEKEAGATRKATVEFMSNAKAAQQAADSVDDLSDSVDDLNKNVNVTTETFKDINGEWVKTSSSADKATRATRRNRQEMTQLGQSFMRTLTGAKQLDRGLQKLGNWRPRLIPPFIALIPIIGAVLALINPLVAGIGAVSVTALGFASSLGRVAGGAIAAIPALATLISLVAALKTAFGGIGGAFQAFGAMKDAAGGGGGGGGAPARAELTRTEQITRAQEAYARSIQDVAWAQEDLNEARVDYIRRLNELRRAVERAAMAEARASANTQLARENYANVLADPGSTKGQKMDAKVGVDEAVADQQDVVQENLDNQRELIEMQRKGIEGDRQVIQAQRALTDAINRQRDAQLELINAQNGANEAAGGGVSAASEYEKMLAKLSPSARKFVETLVAMSDVWTALKRNVQEAFFSEFVDDVDKLRDILPSVESLLSNTAGAMGRVVRQFLLLITSPDWQRDLILIGENNVPIIENVGAALLSWVDAFKDIAVVAGPFLIALTDGLKEGAANFRQIVADARADGSLASYLEEVREKMSQWWRIVKNIGMALFNFSSAASGFGDWLTDGLEKLTMDWRKAGEEAKKEGSPFQVFLENIKPLLVEVRGLFGDFFRWFARTAGDPANIQEFTDIIKLIRDELGPAIGRVLDMLTKSGVGEDFVRAIISIVEAIDTILANGGVDGIKAFFTTVSDLFGALNGFLSSLPQPVLSLLATTFGTLAALRFFGLTSVLGMLVKLATTGGVLKMLDKIAFAFGGSGRRSAPGMFGGGAAGPAAAAGTRRGPGGGAASAARVGGAAAVGTAVGTAFQKGVTFISGLGAKIAPGAGAKVGQGFNLMGSIAKGAGRGAGIGAIAGIVGTVAGDLIASLAPEGAAGAGQRVGGNVLGGAAAGAGVGALIGSVVPGVGTAIGAAAGGIVGGGLGLLGVEQADIDTFFGDLNAGIAQFWTDFTDGFGTWMSEVGEGWDTYWGETVPKFWTDLGLGFVGWLESIGMGWDTFWGETVPAFWTSFVEGFTTFISDTLPTFLGTLAADWFYFMTVTVPEAWDTYWNETFPKFWEDFGEGVTGWFEMIGTNWDTYWTETFPKFWEDFGLGFVGWIEGIGTGWDAYWGKEFPEYWTNFGKGFMGWITSIGVNWDNYWGKEFPEYWTNFGKGFTGWIEGIGANWDNYWGKEFPEFWTNLAAGIGGFFENFGRGFEGLVGDFWSNLTGGFNDRMAQNEAGDKNHWGGYIRRARGGVVPGRGNSDTVRAMLTPGEFVIRKAVVSRIGMENLAKLNSGIMSYAQLLQNSMASQPGSSKPGKGGIEMFNGGGLVPGLSDFGNGSDRPPPPDFGDFGDPGAGGGMSFGDINIINPAPEPASDSLPRTIRKVAYIGGKK